MGCVWCVCLCACVCGVCVCVCVCLCGVWCVCAWVWCGALWWRARARRTCGMLVLMSVSVVWLFLVVAFAQWQVGGPAARDARAQIVALRCTVTHLSRKKQQPCNSCGCFLLLLLHNGGGVMAFVWCVCVVCLCGGVCGCVCVCGCR